MKRRICISVGKKDREQALAQAIRLAGRADVLEIRLDLMADPVVLPFITKLDVPLLFTCRASWEGGGYMSDEKGRTELLKDAARSGCAYVDLELRSPPQSWKELLECSKESATELICSWHDFSGTPGQAKLLTILEDMKKSGANIGKIVTMADDYRDVLRILFLQDKAAEMDFPLIAFCMGKAGVISRAATLSLGGYMTYCAADRGEATAPGQLTVDDLRAIYTYLEK